MAKDTTASDLYAPSAPISTGTLPRWFRRHHHPHVEFDENEAIPSAPPLNLMDQVSGYETISFDAVSVPPPPPREAAASPDSNAGAVNAGRQREVPDLQALDVVVSEQRARQLLVAHAKRRCCYGRGAARDMTIVSIKHSSACKYTLETFTEKRQTAWAYSPHMGEDVDGPENGPAPLPWDLDVMPGQPFTSEVKCVPVPHTASVKQCHRCRGSGGVQCTDCHGKGWIHCLACHGNGYDTDGAGLKERCFYCHSTVHGRGRQDCLKCSGKGRVTCPPCEGGGRLLCFIQLTVTWKVNVSEHIVDSLGIPDHVLRHASGVIAILEEGPRLLPITDFPDETINLASVQLLRDHESNLTNERTIAQRQKVRLIPLSAVLYQWKSHKGMFYICGNEEKVYAPDYPQTCCCGCFGCAII